ncbi:hypothetical protein IQ241_01125 [Romeria aff. gracilis LEGE 07310]|uniref:Uncharacterized protein n=1 Tax=Vasconcelosia minhoensis LEGE 07310 TaxID=915328 RepID=A0A8J7A4U2_9CYAN|nr:hypothetical protein [Romeria gracilis]MBE9075910.1 hypothetical protein [Romeria aff. gracilis LEGE 07310]
MSLPVVLEIALGLIFIYLILSLIASEIQELVSTLLQWRAEHLKQSIEQLLAGDREQDWQSARQLANQLYDSPLIRDLNYEARGRIARFFRGLLHGVGRAYRFLTRTHNVFGQKTSGPSYIPAETFATSLLEGLQLENLQYVLSESRLQQFIEQRLSRPIHRIVSDLKASLANETILDAEMQYLETAIEQIVGDFKERRVTLARSLDRLTAQLDEFTQMALLSLPDSHLTQTFHNRVKYLRAQLVDRFDDGREGGQRIQPTLSELLLLLDNQSIIYREVVNIATQKGGPAQLALAQLQQTVFPDRLRESLDTLAMRAQAKVVATEAGLQQLEAEIEAWFDRAMDRASGVYRRNAKAVGILIGIAIAALINADTFHMVHRLSVDQAVRSSIVQAAEQLETRGINSADDLAADLGTDEISERISIELQSVGAAVSETLEQYPLPLGRNQATLTAQAAAEANWPLLLPRYWLGWILTGIAISMGANFWFDLLRKVISVRTSGNKPESLPSGTVLPRRSTRAAKE